MNQKNKKNMENVFKIAVIMTVHNRKEKTSNCLTKLFANKSNNMLVECFLTADGCTDGTEEAIKSLFPYVKIIKGDGSLFWNRGMYKAWFEASKGNYDFYLWLNDDTLLFDDALPRLLFIAQRDKCETIIVGSTCDKFGKLSYGGRKGNRMHTLIPPDEVRAVSCDTFNGNIVLIPSTVVIKIGINDPYFHHSFGDIEYGMRATKNGVYCKIAPGFYGICERNNPVPLFRRVKYSVFKRYKLLYSPLGFNPCEDFYLSKKYYPLWKCCLWFVKLHLNVLFPKDHSKFE